MKNALILCTLLVLGGGSVLAQTPVASPAAVVQQSMPGIQSQNIADVKPDASQAPDYPGQTNGERAVVQVQTVRFTDTTPARTLAIASASICFSRSKNCLDCVSNC